MSKRVCPLASHDYAEFCFFHVIIIIIVIINKGLPYNICLLCWDKVKNIKTGCRPWIHDQIERNSPGAIAFYKRALAEDGEDSPLFKKYTELFYSLLEDCKHQP